MWGIEGSWSVEDLSASKGEGIVVFSGLLISEFLFLSFRWAIDLRRPWALWSDRGQKGHDGRRRVSLRLDLLYLDKCESGI